MKDDTISRAAAVSEIESIVDTMSVCMSMDECKGMRRMKKTVLERIEALPSAQPEPEEFEWCHTCREYDHEKHCCHRWTKVIRKTVDDMKSAQPGWIPVTESLPDRTDTYLVQVGINENGEGMHTGVRTAEWNVIWQTWYVHTTQRFVGDIIKWMPIPREGGQ